MSDRDKLLADREKLVKEVEALRAKGPSSKSAAALAFFQEDLQKLARKIVNIDKKLGRV